MIGFVIRPHTFLELSNFDNGIEIVTFSLLCVPLPETVPCLCSTKVRPLRNGKHRTVGLLRV